MSRRTRYAFLMMILIASICTTAKVTSDAVRNEYETVMASTPATTAHEESDPVSEFRGQRQQLRSMQKSQLNDIIHDQGSDGDVVKSAQEQLMRLLENESAEAALEGMLKLRGFDDAVTVINNDSVSVMVRAQTLSDRQTAAILDLVVGETKFSPGNVKIIPIN